MSAPHLHVWRHRPAASTAPSKPFEPPREWWCTEPGCNVRVPYDYGAPFAPGVRDAAPARPVEPGER